MDVTIPLTGSAGLRPAWPRRAIAIAEVQVAVVAVAASGMVPSARPYPLIAPFRVLRVLALLAAAGRR